MIVRTLSTIKRGERVNTKARIRKTSKKQNKKMGEEKLRLSIVKCCVSLPGSMKPSPPVIEPYSFDFPVAFDAVNPSNS